MTRFVPALGAVVPALLWIGLAWRSPTSTHHFAPLVVAMAWGFLADPHHRRSALVAAFGGVVVALAALLVLVVADRVMGPTLWGSRPSWPELAGFAILGGAVTLLRAVRRTAARSDATAS